MSLRNLCCFTMVATILVSAVAGRLSSHVKRSDVAKSPLPGRMLAAQCVAWYDGQSANHGGSSRWEHGARPEGDVAPVVFVPAQSKNAEDLRAGKLLVASRGLGDSNFAKTVILLIQSNDQGFVGLILNRRTDIALSRVLEGFQGTKGRSDRAYLGGPVEVPAIFALLKSPSRVDGAEHIFGNVYLLSTKALLEQTLAANADPQVFHVYLGYAGWTKDQLRKEVELGAWFIFPPDSGAVFTADPGSLWPRMIRETELQFAGRDRPASADDGSDLPLLRGETGVL